MKTKSINFYTSSFLYVGLIATLFMPWLLNPNLESFTLEPLNGFEFFYGNLFMLVFFSIVLLTYLYFLKSRNEKVVVLMTLELVFLLALLLFPFITYGLDFLTGVLFGYLLAIAIIVALILYYSWSLFSGKPRN